MGGRGDAGGPAELRRLARTLQRIATLVPVFVTLTATSPFALPLRVERLREPLCTERLKDRL